MKEVIKKIEEVGGFEHDCDTMEGFRIVTDKQEILVLISDYQNCCENSGYLSSFEEPEEFIGAILNKIEIVDDAFNKREWDSMFPYGLDGGDACFVNFETSKGLFQLAVYNSHTGYYGHSILIKSDQVTEESCI